MPLLTTTIGSYPKPAGVPNWFDVRRHTPRANGIRQGLRRYLASGDPSQEAALGGALEVVREQVANGVDIPTDGEIRREHYIYYQCRHFTGFDFAGLTRKEMRRGSWTAEVPTVRGLIRSERPILLRDWRSLRRRPTDP